jgi:hydrogenase/urease accessory protein HupE
MRTFVKRHFTLLVFSSFICFLSAVRAIAHDPFDMSSQATIYSDRIEIVSTLGVDVLKQAFAGAGVSQDEIARTLRSLGPHDLVNHNESLAVRFFELKNSGQALRANAFTSLSEGMEVIVTLTYPRPPEGKLEMKAVCYENDPDLRTGSLIVSDESARRLGAALLSHEKHQLTVSLPPIKPALPATNSGEPAKEIAVNIQAAIPTDSTRPSAQRPDAWSFFILGVEHILTGIDHLLFLAALLIGVRRLSAMLGVITCFTLAHSVTLAVAALNLVSISSRLIEPLIAGSIIIVCIDNFVRRDADRDRWWLAGGFGLIHGFGFAFALRETGLGEKGAELVVPLLNFNLGVEAGQLAVVAVFLPLLFAARRWLAWSRYGAPAISCVVIAVSGYWLVQRLFFV